MAIAHLAGYEEFADFITSSPTLDEIVEFHLSDTTDAHVSELLHRNREGTLTEAEEAELDEYIRLEHIIRMAKIRALEKLDRQA
jgi:hypothetical protein